MNRLLGLLLIVVLCSGGCVIEEWIFPILPPNPFDTPPAATGPFAVEISHIELDEGADGLPLGVTVFRPVGAEGPRPLTVWVLGVNNRAHYHQAFHETMASWGHIQIVPDTRDIRFSDAQYHKRNTDNALLVYDLALDGSLGLAVDTDRTAFGGYSIGGTMAAFCAAREPRAAALVTWAPSPAPAWQGQDPRSLLPTITQPGLFVLGELDDTAPPDGWPSEMQALMAASAKTVEIIPQGVHLFFQEPDDVDDRNPPTTMTRNAQMGIAIDTTRSWLEDLYGS